MMNKVYQPHEGHIPYLLQLFIDFNLYGMNLLNLAAVRFRRSSRAGEHRVQSPESRLVQASPGQSSLVQSRAVQSSLLSSSQVSPVLSSLVQASQV